MIFFDFIQCFTWEGTAFNYLFPALSILLSVWLAISKWRNHYKKVRFTENAYHFTSAEALKLIDNQKVMRAGRDGVIYTTRDPRLSRVGSARAKKKSHNPAVVIFKNGAVNLLKSKNNFWTALIDGHQFYGVIFNEMITRDKGDVIILKSHSYPNVLIVTDAVVIMPAGKRGFFIRYLSWMTGLHKRYLVLIHLGAIASLWGVMSHHPASDFQRFCYISILAGIVVFGQILSSIAMRQIRK